MARIQALGIAVLSGWLAMTLCMWFAATGSFTTVRRVLETPNPTLAEAIHPLSAERARGLLRFLTSEINRTYFRAYGWAQLLMAATLLAIVLLPSRRDQASVIIVAAMLAVVAVLTLYITPEITALGRRMDFLPRDPAPPGMVRFRTLHAAFTTLDGTKLLAGLALLVRLIWGR